MNLAALVIQAILFGQVVPKGADIMIIVVDLANLVIIGHWSSSIENRGEQKYFIVEFGSAAITTNFHSKQPFRCVRGKL